MAKDILKYDHIILAVKPTGSAVVIVSAEVLNAELVN